MFVEFAMIFKRYIFFVYLLQNYFNPNILQLFKIYLLIQLESSEMPDIHIFCVIYG